MARTIYANSPDRFGFQDVETVMFRTLFGSLLLLAAVSCSQAYSDGRAASAPQPMMVAGDPARAAPYGVEIIDERGNVLPTFEQHGKFYVLGDADDRYLIRVSNPTDRRVEAVVTVDGLDVIDGEPGDLRKRGYVVPAGGELRIEGWRTSTSEVATFRFSSVGDSYAGRKGKARNVGVIGVAIFKEKVQEPVYLPTDPTPRRDVDYDDDYGDEGEDYSRSGGGGGGGAETSADDRAPSPPPKASAEPAPEAPAQPTTGTTVYNRSESRAPTRCCDVQPKKKRPGLGTEFGERRSSHVRFVTFVRESSKPVAIVEIRYNDRAGLAALGIPVEPEPDEEEIHLRETADPFPNAPYSEPPTGWR
jgi:hypothetical protein